MTTAIDLRTRSIAITEREQQRYCELTPTSQRANARARKVLPMGVASNFQFFEPAPVVVERASGSSMWDLDGNHFIDYNMGYGSLLAGHSHPLMVQAIQRQLPLGTLYVTPNETMVDVAEELTRRFPMDMVRFTNSGTEATMDALRLARAYTGRDKIIKVEGCYHGHHDLVMVSSKPPVELMGPAYAPDPVPMYGGIAGSTIDEVVVVPYNDPDALERAFASHPGQIAAFILEPVPENMGIVLPDDGYLGAVVEIAHRHGALVIFDEVKTGITSHPRGASGAYGVIPDLVCLAKSVGGGVPVGVFGGRAEIMDLITRGVVDQQSTFNGSPLVMAAARAVLTEICTEAAWAEAKARNDRLLAACQDIIDASGLPAHTVGLGAKGCITYSAERVRNYRDYKATDFQMAYAHWIFMMTHGIFLPPGLDEQWLISVQHTEADIDRHIEVFADFVADLTA